MFIPNVARDVCHIEVSKTKAGPLFFSISFRSLVAFEVDTRALFFPCLETTRVIGRCLHNRVFPPLFRVRALTRPFIVFRIRGIAAYTTSSTPSEHRRRRFGRGERRRLRSSRSAHDGNPARLRTRFRHGRSRIGREKGRYRSRSLSHGRMAVRFEETRLGGLRSGRVLSRLRGSGCHRTIRRRKEAFAAADGHQRCQIRSQTEEIREGRSRRSSL